MNFILNSFAIHTHCTLPFVFQNVSIAIVGKEHPFKIYEDTEVDTYLELISGEERGRGAAQAAAGEEGAQDEGSMETD